MMKLRLGSQLNITTMAAKVNLAPEHFCRLFRTEIGVPPGRYFKELRMEESKKLLATSFLSTQEIIFRVGLRDYSHFVRDFKARYGTTPRKFRHQCSVVPLLFEY
jgi:AraC-like DNA-binding protein